MRESLVEFVQTEPFAPIHVRAAAGATDQTPVFLTSYGGDAYDDEESDQASE